MARTAQRRKTKVHHFKSHQWHKHKVHKVWEAFSVPATNGTIPRVNKVVWHGGGVYLKCFAAHHPSIEQSVEALTDTVGVFNSIMQHFSFSQLMMSAGSGACWVQVTENTEGVWQRCFVCLVSWQYSRVFTKENKWTSQLAIYSHLKIYQCSVLQCNKKMLCSLTIISSFITLEMNFTVHIRGVMVLKLKQWHTRPWFLVSLLKDRTVTLS